MVIWGWGVKREELGRDNETFGGDDYIHLLDCADGVSAEYICQNSSNCTL